MPILEELSPTLTIVGVIITIVLTIIIYFQQVIDAQKRELSIINERTTRLELESEYRQEISDLRREIHELNRELSYLQKRGDV